MHTKFEVFSVSKLNFCHINVSIVNLVCHQEVGHFEVPVDDEVAVEVLQTAKHLMHDALKGEKNSTDITFRCIKLLKLIHRESRFYILDKKILWIFM